MRSHTTQPASGTRRDHAHGNGGTHRAVTGQGEQRARAAGGPQDHALYACHCGLLFAGAVSTHVACPECGADQAW